MHIWEPTHTSSEILIAQGFHLLSPIKELVQCFNYFSKFTLILQTIELYMDIYRKKGFTDGYQMITSIARTKNKLLVPTVTYYFSLNKSKLEKVVCY